MGSVSLKRNLSDLYLGFIIIEAIVLRAEGKHTKKVSTSRMQLFTSSTRRLESKLALNQPLWRINAPYSVGTGEISSGLTIHLHTINKSSSFPTTYHSSSFRETNASNSMIFWGFCSRYQISSLPHRS